MALLIHCYSRPTIWFNCLFPLWTVASHQFHHVTKDISWETLNRLKITGYFLGQHSFIHSFTQSMNKCVKFLLDSRTHVFIFCLDEGYNPYLQRTQGFVRAAAKEQTIRIVFGMSLTEPREVSESILGEDIVKALGEKGLREGWSRQKRAGCNCWSCRENPA